MSDAKISALTAVTTVLDADEYVVARSGASNKITGASLRAALSALLFESTLGADTASIDSGVGGFSTSYDDLMILLYLRTTEAAVASNVTFQFNGDTGANYDDQKMRVINTAVSGAIALAGTSVTIEALGASAQAGAFAEYALWMPAYSHTTGHKSFSGTGARIEDTAADCRSTFQCGRWRSTAAISRVVITAASGSLATGSRMAIYAY